MLELSHEMELKVVAGNETKVLLHDLPDVIAESDVPGFLAQYGYKAKSASEWFSMERPASFDASCVWPYQSRWAHVL